MKTSRRSITSSSTTLSEAQAPCYYECPHKHFRAPLIDRKQLNPKDHIALLATPRGYRWAGEFPPNYSGPKPFSLIKPTRKKYQADQKKLEEAEQRYMQQFVSQIFPMMSPEMVVRLKRMLVVEFGMTPKKAEEFIKTQNSSTKKTKKSKAKKYYEIDANVKGHWLKEFERLLTAKMTDYLVSMFCARRSKKVEAIAQNVLSQIGDITGESCALDDPRNQVQRIQVFLAERFAVWLATLLEKADSKICEEYSKWPTREPEEKISSSITSAKLPEEPTKEEETIEKVEDLEKDKEDKKQKEEEEPKVTEEKEKESQELKEEGEKLKEVEDLKEESVKGPEEENPKEGEEKPKEEKSKEEEGKQKMEEEKQKELEEQKLKEEEERKKKIEEQKQKEEEAKRKKELEEQKLKEEEEQKKKLEEQKQKEEEEKRKKELEEQKLKEEEEQKKELEEQKQKEEEEKRKKQLDEQKSKEEERKKKLEEQKQKEEEERKKKLEEKKLKEEEERKKELEEQNQKEEEERKKELEEQKLKEEEERKKELEEQILKEEEKYEAEEDEEEDEIDTIEDEKGEEEKKTEDEGGKDESATGDKAGHDATEEIKDAAKETEPMPADQKDTKSVEGGPEKSMGDALITEDRDETSAPQLGKSKAAYRIRKDQKGCFYEVQKIEQKEICDRTKIARKKRIAMVPATICARPKTSKIIKTSKDIKNWSKWATGVANFVENWSDWIMKTTKEMEAHVGNEQPNGYREFKENTERGVLELKRNKKYIKESSKDWKKKLNVKT